MDRSFHLPAINQSRRSQESSSPGTSGKLPLRRNQPERLALLENIKRNRRRLRASDEFGICEENERVSKRLISRQVVAAASPPRDPRTELNIDSPASSHELHEDPAPSHPYQSSADETPLFRSVLCGDFPAVALAESDDVDKLLDPAPLYKIPDGASGQEKEHEAAAEIHDDQDGMDRKLDAGSDVDACDWVREAVSELQHMQAVDTKQGACWECGASLEGHDGLHRKGVFCDMSCFGTYVLGATMSRRRQDLAERCLSQPMRTESRAEN